DLGARHREEFRRAAVGEGRDREVGPGLAAVLLELGDVAELGLKAVLELEAVGLTDVAGADGDTAAAGEVDEALVADLEGGLHAARVLVAARDEVGLAAYRVDFEAEVGGL